MEFLSRITRFRLGLINEFIDTVNHELLIAKLHSYGYSIKALEILLIYLQE